MTLTLRQREAPPRRYHARIAAVPRDIHLAQALRHLCLVAMRGRAAQRGDPSGGQDAASDHILIEDRDGALAGSFRVRQFRSGRDLGDGHAARSFDLSALAALPGPVTEVAEFCAHPDADGSDVAQLAWGVLMTLAERQRACVLLVSCAFDGTDPDPHREAFAYLRANHVGSPEWLPRNAAAETVPLESLGRPCNPVAALRGLPPFLRHTLGLGARVSDHAVVDRTRDALDVLAVLDLSRVPRDRAAALRAIAPRLD
ncbi:GNAT family N-acyltransferase [Rubellimicrobium rubrum]|nr:GNAT family N-acyltransferase [Rubellimicrobium rubrum]